jgi:hypothetical protein
MRIAQKNWKLEEAEWRKVAEKAATDERLAFKQAEEAEKLRD